MEQKHHQKERRRKGLTFHRQVSETIRLGILLALSGGLMDAYS